MIQPFSPGRPVVWGVKISIPRSDQPARFDIVKLTIRGLLTVKRPNVISDLFAAGVKGPAAEALVGPEAPNNFACSPND